MVWCGEDSIQSCYHFHSYLSLSSKTHFQPSQDKSSPQLHSQTSHHQLQQQSVVSLKPQKQLKNTSQQNLEKFKTFKQHSLFETQNPLPPKHSKTFHQHPTCYNSSQTPSPCCSSCQLNLQDNIFNTRELQLSNFQSSEDWSTTTTDIFKNKKVPFQKKVGEWDRLINVLSGDKWPLRRQKTHNNLSSPLKNLKWAIFLLILLSGSSFSMTIQQLDNNHSQQQQPSQQSQNQQYHPQQQNHQQKLFRQSNKNQMFLKHKMLPTKIDLTTSYGHLKRQQSRHKYLQQRREWMIREPAKWGNKATTTTALNTSPFNILFTRPVSPFKIKKDPILKDQKRLYRRFFLKYLKKHTKSKQFFLRKRKKHSKSVLNFSVHNNDFNKSRLLDNIQSGASLSTSPSSLVSPIATVTKLDTPTINYTRVGILENRIIRNKNTLIHIKTATENNNYSSTAISTSSVLETISKPQQPLLNLFLNPTDFRIHDKKRIALFRNVFNGTSDDNSSRKMPMKSNYLHMKLNKSTPKKHLKDYKYNIKSKKINTQIDTQPSKYEVSPHPNIIINSLYTNLQTNTNIDSNTNKRTNTKHPPNKHPNDDYLEEEIRTSSPTRPQAKHPENSRNNAKHSIARAATINKAMPHSDIKKHNENNRACINNNHAVKRAYVGKVNKVSTNDDNANTKAIINTVIIGSRKGLLEDSAGIMLDVGADELQDDKHLRLKTPHKRAPFSILTSSSSYYTSSLSSLSSSLSSLSSSSISSFSIKKNALSKLPISFQSSSSSLSLSLSSLQPRPSSSIFTPSSTAPTSSSFSFFSIPSSFPSTMKTLPKNNTTSNIHTLPNNLELRHNVTKRSRVASHGMRNTHQTEQVWNTDDPEMLDGFCTPFSPLRSSIHLESSSHQCLSQQQPKQHNNKNLSNLQSPSNKNKIADEAKGKWNRKQIETWLENVDKTSIKWDLLNTNDFVCRHVNLQRYSNSQRQKAIRLCLERPPPFSTTTFPFCNHLRISDAFKTNENNQENIKDTKTRSEGKIVEKDCDSGKNDEKDESCEGGESGEGDESSENIGALLRFDQNARQMYMLFEEAISYYHCQDTYSISNNCSQCKAAYKLWSCSLLIPHYKDTVKVPSCPYYEQIVQNRCPYLAPHRNNQYAGEALFQSRNYMASVNEVSRMEDSSRPSCHYLCLNNTINPPSPKPSNNSPTDIHSSKQPTSNKNLKPSHFNSFKDTPHKTTANQHSFLTIQQLPSVNPPNMHDNSGYDEGTKIPTQTQTDERNEGSHTREGKVVSVCLSHDEDDAPDWSFDDEDDAILNFQPT